MIDFRYHLVSIVSIFVALAVGIVLGAGPLQGGIGTQLTDQVSQLRSDMETLRTQRDDYATSLSAQQDYAAAVAPAALRDRLEGEGVVLVVTPDTAGKFSELTATALQQAGASVTTVVTLQDSFRAPEAAANRSAAVAKAVEALGIAPGTSDTDALVAEVLTTSLLRPPGGTTVTNPASPPSQTTPSSRATGGAGATVPAGAVDALATLRSAGLIDLSDDTPAPARLAVVLGGPLSGTATSVTTQSATMTALLRALAAASGGVVVAAGPPSTAVGQETTTNLVSVVRADARLAAAMSSVDHADTVVGAGVVVLALVDQEGGRAGHYGISADARAVVPPTP